MGNGVFVSELNAGGDWFERYRAGSRAARRNACGAVRTERAQGIAGAIERRLSRGERRCGRAESGARFIRGVCAVGIYGRGGRRRTSIGGCDGFLLARRPWGAGGVAEDK